VGLAHYCTGGFGARAAQMAAMCADNPRNQEDELGGRSAALYALAGDRRFGRGGSTGSAFIGTHEPGAHPGIFFGSMVTAGPLLGGAGIWTHGTGRPRFSFSVKQKRRALGPGCEAPDLNRGGSHDVLANSFLLGVSVLADHGGRPIRVFA